jgi:hypothetical protein
MANTFKFGNGQWATKDGYALAYNDENGNFKPLPFDFTRASSATRVNKQGLIETVASGVPRIDFLNNSNGALLLEPTRTNLIAYSEDFSNAAWSKNNLTVTSSAAISPDGSLNADLLNFTSSGNYIDYAGTITIGQTYTVSCYVKSAVDLNQTFVIYGNANKSSGTITATSEWQRFTHTFTADITAMSSGIISTALNQLYVWGFQLEQASYPTSYIPTQGSAVTRVAEVCKQDNLLTDIINASYPFTMYAEAKAVIDDSQQFLTFSDRGVTNAYFTLVLNSDGTVKLDARANGISEYINSSATAITNGDFFKTAITMESATSGKICVNGVLDSKTNFTQQAVNTNINDLLVGMLRTATDTGRRMPVKDVKLYNTALTDAELQALTS